MSPSPETFSPVDLVVGTPEVLAAGSKPEYAIPEGVAQLTASIKSKIAINPEGPIVLLIEDSSTLGTKGSLSQKLLEEFPYASATVPGNHYISSLDTTSGSQTATPQFDLDRFLQGLNIQPSEPSGTQDPVLLIQDPHILASEARTGKSRVIRVLVCSNSHQRMLRHLFRDPAEAKKDPAAVLRHFLIVEEPEYQSSLPAKRQKADMIIRDAENVSPIEASKSGLCTQQVKFAVTDDLSGIAQRLRSNGGEDLGTTRQQDEYHTPPQTDLKTRQEMVRIRREAGKSGGGIFTYKGAPHAVSGVQERIKFECCLDAEDIALLVERIYGGQSLVIEKERQIFSFGGVIVTLDTGVRRSLPDGSVQELGNFLEFRTNLQTPDARKKLEQAIQQAGFGDKPRITESYLGLNLPDSIS